jgi:trehalose/maltose hydrolase-like predicted phosphorylase
VIRRDVFAVAPWSVPERTLHLELLGQTESVFALSNGHIGLRGNLDEGEPAATPGTYLNAFYETRPLPYAEAGYGYPEDGQSLIDVTNGKLLRLLVDDEPFDIRRSGPRSCPRATGTTGCGPGCSTARARAGCGWRRGWTTSSTGRRGR